MADANRGFTPLENSNWEYRVERLTADNSEEETVLTHLRGHVHDSRHCRMCQMDGEMARLQKVARDCNRRYVLTQRALDSIITG